MELIKDIKELIALFKKHEIIIKVNLNKNVRINKIDMKESTLYIKRLDEEITKKIFTMNEVFEEEILFLLNDELTVTKKCFKANKKQIEKFIEKFEEIPKNHIVVDKLLKQEIESKINPFF